MLRRLARAAALALLAALLGGGAAGADVVDGVVYRDRNGNGVRDVFDFGVRGVAVSNGRDVVRTDWRGRFRIAFEPGRFVFVVKPGGWQLPLDSDGLARFYRRIDARPDAPLEFPLTRHRERRRFRAVVLGDPQVYDAQQLDWLGRDVVAELIGTDAAFGISLGDLVGDDPTLLEPLAHSLGRIRIPWHHAIGNHDVDFDAASDADSSASFERVFGPVDYAFEVGRVHFIVLDDVVYDGAQPDGTPGGYHGGLSQRQLGFVARYLEGVAAGRLVVLVMHIPFDSPPFSVEGWRELLDVVGDRPALSLVGHTHFLEHQWLDTPRGPHHQFIAGAASGSWWLGAPDEDGIPHATMRCGAPNGWALIDFDGARYRIAYRAARRPASHQMNIYAPVSVAVGDGAEILVNVFNGAPDSRVRMRLGDGEWTDLERDPRPDPAYVEITERDQLRVPRPRFFVPPPMPSPHLWAGALPPPSAPGVQTLEVEAELQPGQVVRGRQPLRITEPPAR